MMPNNTIFPESWNIRSWVPRIFCISAGCKCDLYLLTRSGRSFDVNWTFCWRKLLTETWWSLTETGRSLEGKRDGLDTETGWSIDWIWMVNWRKLDGLLMERVKSINGNRPADFHHFGSQKMRFFRVLKPTASWTPRILLLIFCNLEVRKCYISRVVKPRVQCYEVSSEQILRILASWKCDFRRFAKPVYLAKSEEIFFFLRPENANMSSR